MTSSNGNVFRVTGPLCGEFTGHRWIPLSKASDAELWCSLWSAPWINSWVNNGEAGDLRHHRAHYDVNVMYVFVFHYNIISRKVWILTIVVTLFPWLCHWYGCVIILLYLTIYLYFIINIISMMQVWILTIVVTLFPWLCHWYGCVIILFYLTIYLYFIIISSAWCKFESQPLLSHFFPWLRHWYGCVIILFYPTSLHIRDRLNITMSSHQRHSGKAYEGTCRIPRQNGDGRGIASARFVWIVKAIESAARPPVVCGY